MTTALRHFRERVKRWINAVLGRFDLELRRAPFVPDRQLEFTLAHLLAVEFVKGREPVLVQVGANDAVLADPLFDLVRQRTSLRGLLIEPEPTAFERLREAYPRHSNITLLNVAIAPEDGVATMYAVDPDRRSELPEDLGDWVDQLTSFDREHLLAHLADHLPRAGDWIKPIEVAGLTLATALERAGIERFDALQIDAEGMDHVVLNQALDDGHRPRMIGFEHCHLSQSDRRQVWRRLGELGYEVSLQGTDTIALRGSSAVG